MILYSITLSPFAARARLALRIKGLEYDMQSPPGGGTRSPEYLAINPIGKLPVLITDDGLAIAESETIIDYLDDAYPEPSLTPADPAERAQMRNVVRAFELYVVPSLTRLFNQADPQTRNAEIVSAEIERMRDGLTLVARFVNDAQFAVGGAISKADCILLPSLILLDVVAEMFALDDLVAPHPSLAGYRDKARRHPDMGAISTETWEALAVYRARS